MTNINLSPLQQAVLTYVSRHSIDNPISNARLNKLTKLMPHSDKAGADMRAVIHALRAKGYPICANDKGYYWAADEHQLAAYISSLRLRIQKTEEAAEGMLYGKHLAGVPYGESSYRPVAKPPKIVVRYKVMIPEQGYYGRERPHTVCQLADGRLECDCQSFLYSVADRCAHVDRVREKYFTPASRK